MVVNAFSSSAWGTEADSPELKVSFVYKQPRLYRETCLEEQTKLMVIDYMFKINKFRLLWVFCLTEMRPCYSA